MTRPAPRIAQAAPTQIEALDAMIRVALRSRLAAMRGDLFHSRQGMALLNAMYDVAPVDGLHELIGEVALDLGLDRDGSAVMYLADAS